MFTPKLQGQEPYEEGRNLGIIYAPLTKKKLVEEREVGIIQCSLP